jgi:leucyl-tRNA synthetase
MPIKACADKLRGEIEAYGCPPVFPEESAEEAAPAVAAPAPVDPLKHKSVKSKVASKKGSGTSQWAILKSSGIPEDEIHMFQCAPLPCATAHEPALLVSL